MRMSFPKSPHHPGWLLESQSSHLHSRKQEGERQEDKGAQFLAELAPFKQSMLKKVSHTSANIPLSRT